MMSSSQLWLCMRMTQIIEIKSLATGPRHLKLGEAHQVVCSVSAESYFHGQTFTY